VSASLAETRSGLRAGLSVTQSGTCTRSLVSDTLGAVTSDGTGPSRGSGSGSGHAGVGGCASRLFGDAVDLFQAGLAGNVVFGVL
jgi:hypothetical protein